MAPIEGRRPNQLELETQRTNLMLQETLANLDRTLAGMKGTQDQLNLGVKLDAVMDDLAASNMSTKMAMREFKNIQQRMSNGLMQQQQAEQIQIGQRIQAAGQGLAEVNAQLAEYSPDYADTPSRETMGLDFTNTINMNSTINRYMYGDSRFGIRGESRALKAAGYLTNEEFTSPYFNPGAGSQSTAEQELAWFRQLDKLARKGSAAEVRQFLEFERSRQEEVQKAMLNKQVSEALGTNGMIQRSEFEGLVQPGLSSFADDYGIAIDQAADVIRKMHELGVISEQVNTGDGISILNALDKTDEIFGKLKKVVKSDNVQELMAYADQLTRIGGGDFETGLKAVQGNTSAIVGGLMSSSQSMEQAAAAAQRFGGMFGQDTLAAMNAGAWDARIKNVVQNYAGGHEFRIGQVNYAADLYTQSLMEQAQGTKALLLANGGGADALSGAYNLINKMQDMGATEFYLKLPEMMKEAQEKMTGAAADVNLQLQVENLQRAFGFSEDEALLAVFKDPAKVAAFKEVQAAKKARADEIQRTYDSAKYLGTYRPGEFDVKFLNDKEKYDVSDISLEGDLLDTLGVRRGLSDLSKNIDRLTFELKNTDGTYDVSGLTQRNARSLSDLKVNSEKIKEFGTSEIINVVVSSIATEAAQERIEKIMKKVHDDGYRPKINDIQEVIMDGLLEYTNTGLLRDPETQRRVKEYVAGLTPDIADKDISPLLSDDDPMKMLITAVRDFGSVAQDLLTPEQLFKQQMVGSLYESGVDIRNNIAGSGILGDISGFLNEHKGAVAAIGGAATFIPGVGLLTGMAIGLGAAVLPTVVEGINNMATYFDTVAGDGVDMGGLYEMWGMGRQDVTAIESEIRTYLSFIASLQDAWQSGKSRKCYAELKKICMDYCSAAAAQGKEKGSLKVLDDETLDSLIQAEAAYLYNNWSKQGHKQGGDNDFLETVVTQERVIQVVAVILRGINAPGSQVGQYLRAHPDGGSLYNARASKDDDDKGDIYRIATQDMKEYLDDVLYADKDIQSIQNMLKQNPNADVSGMVLSVVQNKGKLEEVQKHFASINQSITLSSGSADEKDRARKVTEKIKKWIQSNSEEPMPELSEEDVKAVETVMGKGFGEQLRAAGRLEDKGKAKVEVLNWMDSIGRQSEEVAQQADDRAQDFVKNFTRTAQLLMNNPDASELSRQLYMHITRGGY